MGHCQWVARRRAVQRLTRGIPAPPHTAPTPFPEARGPQTARTKDEPKNAVSVCSAAKCAVTARFTARCRCNNTHRSWWSVCALGGHCRGCAAPWAGAVHRRGGGRQRVAQQRAKKTHTWRMGAAHRIVQIDGSRSGWPPTACARRDVEILIPLASPRRRRAIALPAVSRQRNHTQR